VQIDIYSDVVCPWCYIGKRRLEGALSETGLRDADVHWRAYQLNPDLPPEGMDRRQYMRAKFGPDALGRIHGRLTEAGLSVGIDFQFGRIERAPNTFNAHRLLHLARERLRQEDLAESLFHAYFIDGRDIGDSAVLAELAVAAGLGDIHAWLAGDSGSQAVLDDLAEAARLGISGVPFYVFPGRYAVTGAQPSEIFVRAINLAAGESPR
jgi:predicted DsbA family dithiol-disulfide isomerase